MLASSKIEQVKEFVAAFTREETIWLSGYLSGLAAGDKTTIVTDDPIPSDAGRGHKPGVTAAAAVTPATQSPGGGNSRVITLTYGTETGNAKKLATRLAARIKKEGLPVKLAALDQYRLSDLPNEEKFLVVISTQGEGEPPVGAKNFYDHLFGAAPVLSRLQYAVLALGDSSYPLFCKTGEDVDTQLRKLGGYSLLPLQKCDVDYEEPADQWLTQILQSLKGATVAASVTNIAPALKTKTKIIYEGTVLKNINLNGRGAKKATYHIEIAAEALQYEPGDSMGVIPGNRKEVVDEIIRLAGVDAEKIVVTERQTASIRELLTNHLNICYLLSATVKSYAALTAQTIPDTRMDLKDLLRIYPVKTPEQFIDVMQLLKPVAPRLYSISSAPAAHPGEVHITVAKNNFLLQNEQHFGLCSAFLGDLVSGASINFYVHKNRAFKLPPHDRDIVMIGPGTGIAPFRSFVAERDAVGATGRSWLFFGDQHFTTDFNYQTEWQAWLSTGALTKMNVAFSRDQPEKIYVQHKMQQHAAELFSWLEGGAYLYVAGSKHPMSSDVEGAVIKIIEEQKKVNEADAIAYLQLMKKEGRYQKDVY